jgi:hypothetical protein
MRINNLLHFFNLTEKKVQKIFDLTRSKNYVFTYINRDNGEIEIKTKTKQKLFLPSGNLRKNLKKAFKWINEQTFR